MGQEKRTAGRKGKREGQEKKKGQEKREGGEGTEGQEVPCQETYHPSGSHHELVVQTKLVSSAFYQQQRAELVAAPVKLVHVLP